MFARVALRAMFIALIALPVVGAFAASADDGLSRGPDATGRPSSTILRPTEFRVVSLPAAAPVPTGRQLVVLVGGFGSSASDDTFDAITRRLGGSAQYDIVRFGADAAHPYDTHGPLDASAKELVAEIRERSPGHAGVSVITHSMGGAVLDRAFANGLSSEDGLETVVSLAPPRSGAMAARAATGLLFLAGSDAPVVRGLLSPIQDPTLPAVGDLARERPVLTPDGVQRLDLRLATDLAVLSADARAPGTDSRTLLPVSIGGINGHGGILRDRRTLDLVATTLAERRVPSEARTPHELIATGAIAAMDDGVSTTAQGLVVVGLLGLLVALRVRRMIAPVRVSLPGLSPW